MSDSQLNKGAIANRPKTVRKVRVFTDGWYKRQW